MDETAERRALVGMVAAWEALLDEETRCFCKDSMPLLTPGARPWQRINWATQPPTGEPCAYCVAKAVLGHGRLAMDEQKVGRG